MTDKAQPGASFTLSVSSDYFPRPDDPIGGFSYFTEPGLNATLIELTALTTRKRRTVDAIAHAAASWTASSKVHRFKTVADLARSEFVGLKI